MEQVTEVTSRDRGLGYQSLPVSAEIRFLARLAGQEKKTSESKTRRFIGVNVETALVQDVSMLMLATGGTSLTGKPLQRGAIVRHLLGEETSRGKGAAQFCVLGAVAHVTPIPPAPSFTMIR